MKLALSFAIVLHRVFDSAPPEKAAAFWSSTRRLQPFCKPGGLHVFVDTEPDGPLLIQCPGYLDAWADPVREAVLHVRMFPSGRYIPPPGWTCTRGDSAPGTPLFLPDPAYRVRIVSREAENAVHLQVRPGFVDGCLGWGGAQYALVIRKQSPDLFVLDEALPRDAEQLHRGYAALTDADGIYTLVAPAGFVESSDAAPRKEMVVSVSDV